VLPIDMALVPFGLCQEFVNLTGKVISVDRRERFPPLNREIPKTVTHPYSPRISRYRAIASIPR